MEKTLKCCSRSSLVALVVLVLFPVRSHSEEESYTSLMEAQPECCVSAEAELKRFGDIDYDSFVGLMGRRSAAQPHRRAEKLIGHLLGRRTINKLRRSWTSAGFFTSADLQTRRGEPIQHKRQRFPLFV